MPIYHTHGLGRITESGERTPPEDYCDTCGRKIYRCQCDIEPEPPDEEPPDQPNDDERYWK